MSGQEALQGWPRTLYLVFRRCPNPSPHRERPDFGYSAHPAFRPFPETFFFINARRRHRCLEPPAARYRRVLLRTLTSLGRQELQPLIERQHGTLRRATAAYIRVLDHIALEDGKSRWIEKSPGHLRHIDWISGQVKNTHFVLVIRDGRDVVASVRNRALRFPTEFGSQVEPTVAIRRWNQSIRRSLAYLDQTYHTFVLFEDFTEQPRDTTKRVFAVAGLELEVRLDPERAIRQARAAHERVQGKPNCLPMALLG